MPARSTWRWRIVCIGFYGAAKAAAAAGDGARATAHFEKLARLTRYGDGDRNELREMKERLAGK